MTKQNNMTADERYCYDCIHNEVCRYCPHDGCEFKETLKEAKPVKHGRWIDFPECLEYDGALDEDYFVCSECHHVWNTMDNCAETFRCCPNCGSKNRMDGDSK